MCKYILLNLKPFFEWVGGEGCLERVLNCDEIIKSIIENCQCLN